MKILVPAAGMGTRFADKGWSTLKPLIKVAMPGGNELPMMLAVLQRADPSYKIYYGVRPEDVELFGDKIFEETFRSVTMVPAHQWRSGQSATLYDICGRCGDLDEPCLVYNSDVLHDFDPEELVHRARVLAANCMISVQESQDPSCSYVDKFPFFDKAVEKVIVSKYAITGLYYFQQTRLLNDALRYQMDHCYRVQAEFYLSGALEFIDAPRGAFLARRGVHDLGTPEKLMDYEDKTICTS